MSRTFSSLSLRRFSLGFPLSSAPGQPPTPCSSAAALSSSSAPVHPVLQSGPALATPSLSLSFPVPHPSRHSTAMLYALSGTRFPLSSHQAHTLGRLLPALSAHLRAIGGQVATGCCPTGLDQGVRQFFASSPLLRVFSVQGVRSPAALRARTLAMVHASQCLIAFPQSAVFAHSGTWLSIFAAAAAGIPVFVCMPSAGVPLSTLPCCRGILGWSLSPAPPVPGAQGSFFSPSHPQLTLPF